MDETGKRFLDRFPEQQRSAVENAFLGLVRAAGDCDPTDRDICSQVFWDICQKAKAGDGTAQRWMGIFREHKVEALAAADYYIDYEKLPEEERERSNRDKEEEGKRAYMKSQAPTEKQLALLKRLKHEGTPSNRLEASDLIESLKTW